MKDVLNFVLDKLGVRYFSNIHDQYSHMGSSLALPKDCGQNELVKYCFAELHKDYAEDYNILFCNFIKTNSTVQEIKELWFKEAIDVVGEVRTQWLHYGLHLGSLSLLNQKDLEELLSDDPDNLERIILVYRAAQLEKVASFEKYYKILVDSVLSGDFVAPYRQKCKTVPELFIQLLNITRYARTINNPLPTSLAELLKRRDYPSIELENLPMEQNLASSDYNKFVEIIRLVQTEHNRTVKEWASELAPWDNIVELLRSLWGEQWLHFHFANVASGIKSPKETYRDFSDLLDTSKSLCKRARYARLRAGAPEWWKNQLEAANTEQEKMFVLLLLLTWGSFNTIIHLIESINSIFNQMSTDNWHRIIRTLNQTAFLLDMDEGKNNLAIDVTKLPSDLSARIVTIFGLRTKPADATILYQKYLLTYQGSDKYILQFCQETAFGMALADPNYWQQSLTTIAFSYAKGIILGSKHFGNNPTRQVSFPIQVAEEIAEHPEKYPRILTPSAEGVFRMVVTQNIIPVGEIAKDQHWFEE